MFPRGWGKTVQKSSDKGLTGPTTRVIDDIVSFTKSLIPSPIPLFMMGHSMGGGETLCFMAQAPPDVRKHIRGYLLESPFVDFSYGNKPSAITVALGRFVGRFFPHRHMVNKLNEKLISRDPAIQKQFKEDDLCHDTGTLEGLAGMVDRTIDLASGKINIPDDAGEGGLTRIWIGHGDNDGFTDHAASKALYERLTAKDKEFKTYEGHFHRRKYYTTRLGASVANLYSTRRAQPV
jgi:acylglycerol lipase